MEIEKRNYEYSRKAYPSRGLKKNRDFLMEAFKKTKECETCGGTYTRKVYDNGRVQSWKRFEESRNCSLECFRAWQTVPEHNGRFKNIMPKCKDCGKKVGYQEHGQGGAKRCQKCSYKFLTKSGALKERGQRLINQGFGFKKGVLNYGNGFKKGVASFWKGKTLEAVYGKRKAAKIKKRTSKIMKDLWSEGTFNHIIKPKVEWACVVCGKKALAAPWEARKRKTCGFSCSGKLNKGIVRRRKTLACN